MVAPRKPGGKLGGGLGVRKLDAKVDESVFDQAPAPEAVKPAVADPLPLSAHGSVSSPSAVAAAAAGSRFSYETLTQVREVSDVRDESQEVAGEAGRGGSKFKYC